MASMLYSLIRVVLDAIATSHHNEAKLSGTGHPLPLRTWETLVQKVGRPGLEPALRMAIASQRPWQDRTRPDGRRAKIDRFAFWHGLRATFQISTLVVLLWALVVATRQRASD